MISVEDPLITLESDKATMDVPSSTSGAVQEIYVKVGDRVSEGTTILSVASADAPVEAASPAATAAAQEPATEQSADPAKAAAAPGSGIGRFGRSVSRPGRRWQDHRLQRCPRRAQRAPGRPRAGRWTSPRSPAPARKAASPRRTCSSSSRAPPPRPAKAAAPAATSGIPEIPAQDFSKFGPVEVKAMGADQEGVRAAPAPLVAQHPARHPPGRGGHHRDRRLPQGARHRGQGRGLPGDLAGVPDQGRRSRR